MAAPARPGWDAAPRYATARDRSRPSYGRAIGQVAAAMGKPLQPWQQLVADVATEVLPDGSWAYPVVVVHVQRQGGKTTLLGPKNVHRCLTRPAVKCWLTAQQRQAASATFADIAELVGRSPLAALASYRRSNGSEGLSFPATGSRFGVFAPNETALHGTANESVDVDEVWAFDGAEGDQLEQAILPTFTTTGGQLWLVSTAGTSRSTWLRRYVERGRAAVEAGASTGVAYFEWSLDPAEAEAVGQVLTEAHRVGADQLGAELQAELERALDVVLSRHPGQYVRRDAVRAAALSTSPGGFLRAYGNVWTLTADRAIPDHAWQASRDEQLPAPEAGAVQLAFDVSLARQGAVSASWLLPDGQVAVDTIDSRPGTSWMAERIEQLAGRWGCTEVVCDPRGPALDVADELERRGVVRVRRLTTVEALTACAGLLSDVEAGNRLRHRGTDALDRAAAAAAVRYVGDRWLWARRTSADNIAPLTSATWARYALQHAPAPVPAPLLVVGAPDSKETSPAPAARRGRVLQL